MALVALANAGVACVCDGVPLVDDTDNAIVDDIYVDGLVDAAVDEEDVEDRAVGGNIRKPFENPLNEVFEGDVLGLSDDSSQANWCTPSCTISMSTSLIFGVQTRLLL